MRWIWGVTNLGRVFDTRNLKKISKAIQKSELWIDEIISDDIKESA